MTRLQMQRKSAPTPAERVGGPAVAEEPKAGVVAVAPKPDPKRKGTGGKMASKDLTVEEWIETGVRAIMDEHKLSSLSAVRTPAGKTEVEFIADPRAMHALRENGRKKK